MSDSTIVLYYWHRRRALAQAYFSRPNHTVIGTVRSTTLPFHRLATSAASAGSTHLNIVIPRAGVAKPGRTPAIVAIDDVVNVFSVNAVGALCLLQATGASLECPKKEPKLALVQREMGNKGAQMMEAPNTTEEAITKTMATIDGTTQENSSGKYLNIIDGTNFGDDLYRKDYDEKEKRRRCLAG
ncbi:hypothetical protein BDW68DRAFT_186976 [Aspergillus falconensis]